MGNGIDIFECIQISYPSCRLWSVYFHPHEKQKHPAHQTTQFLLPICPSQVQRCKSLALKITSQRKTIIAVIIETELVIAKGQVAVVTDVQLS